MSTSRRWTTPGAQTALADADDLRMAGDDGVQHRVLLVGTQRVDTAARRLVDDEPALALGDDAQREVGPRLGPLLVGTQGSQDPEFVARCGEARFVRQREGAAGLDDAADLEQVAHPGPRDGEPLRQEAVEPLARVLGTHMDDRRLQSSLLARPGRAPVHPEGADTSSAKPARGRPRPGLHGAAARG